MRNRDDCILRRSPSGDLRCKVTQNSRTHKIFFQKNKQLFFVRIFWEGDQRLDTMPRAYKNGTRAFDGIIERPRVYAL